MPLPTQQSLLDGTRVKRLAQEVRKPRRDRMRGDITKALAVVDIQATVRRAA